MASNLPPELIEDEILTRLPVKSLVRFRSVSKHWLELLTSDPIFIQKHLKQTLEDDEKQGGGFILHAIRHTKYYHIPPNGSFENPQELDTSVFEKELVLDGYFSYLPDVYQSYLSFLEFQNVESSPGILHMVGSSNGLICLSFESHNSQRGSAFYIWNPATRQYKKIPHSAPRAQFSDESTGFCFDPAADDYKVVRLVEFFHGVVLDVFSLKMNSWGLVGAFDFSVPNIVDQDGVVVNGGVHWLGTTITSPNRYEIIISFSLMEETVREVPMPANFDPLDVDNGHLQVLRKCLSMLVTNRKQYIDIWVMKDYGVKESWAKLFTVESMMVLHGATAIGFLKNSEVLLQMAVGLDLVSYESENEAFNTIQILELEGSSAMATMPYVESLVQLDATQNEVGTKTGGRNSNI